MADQPEDFEFTSFAYETLDPTDYKTIGKIIVQISASESPLTKIANGDDEYLRFLREDAAAQLDLRVNPNDDEVYERALRTHAALKAYEATINGIS